MTEPVPVPPPLNEPLMSLAELAKWIIEPEIPEDRVDFAYMVMEGAAVVIREAGSIWWAYNDTGNPLADGYIRIPYRAKLLYDLKVKNFYQHPTGAVSETVGPLSERYLDEVVQQLQLNEDEKLLLAQLAEDDGDPATAPSLQIWALSTTRGPMETGAGRGGEVIHVPYWRTGSKMLPYYAAGALGSPW